MRVAALQSLPSARTTILLVVPESDLNLYPASHSTRIAARTMLAARQQLSRKPGIVVIDRVWPESACPYCAAAAPTSFEFGSHRRTWYACLSCDQVWLALRRE